MYLVEKEFSFEAGHCLVHHDGKCSSPHGHSYVFIVTLAGHQLIQDGPQKNMIIDFYTLDAAIAPMIEDYLDHKWLNDSLGTDSPSVEFIAKWIYDHLKPTLKNLRSVKVFETPTCSATYTPYIN